jgi:glycosyltransferase involved in cell wall biosynthesis
MPHGMLDPYSLRQKRWRKKIYLAAFERSNIQKASQLIFTTSQEQKNARQSLPWLPPGEIIPLGADCPPEISQDDCVATFISHFPQVVGRRCLLFLGRIHKKKGVERLLKLLPAVTQKHPETLLVIAGTGETRYVDSIKDLVQIEKVAKNVLFTGMLTGSVKYGALGCAEAFLLPSKQENFAIAVAEAMHMAVPIVISDKVNSWPLVREANAGFIVEEEHIETGFAEVIDRILCNPEQARCLGKNGQYFAREHLTWQKTADATVRLYQRVLAE